MKSLVFFALTMAFSPFTFAGFSLSGQPEIKEEAYNAQLGIIREKVLKSIKVTDSIEVFEDELSIAPLVVRVDFQKSMKVAQGVSVLGEYSSWIDLEQAIWGFQDAVNSADVMIGERLEQKLGGQIYAIDESTKSESAMFISFPIPKPDLNYKVPSGVHDIVAYESFGFDAEDNLKATNIELAEMEEGDGVVFFPYINLTLHKQTATTSQMNGELMINYVAAMNGYFALCIKEGCFTAELPNKTYIDLIIPLVHRKEATSDETQIAARIYGQELMAQMITEFTMAAFEKLSSPDPE